MKLKTLPIEVDARAIAEGLLDMFDDEERAILRFGMLPAVKMEILQEQFDAKFRSLASYQLDESGDQFTAVLNPPHPRYVDFSMKALVREAVHAVCLELYAIGDLVV